MKASTPSLRPDIPGGSALTAGLLIGMTLLGFVGVGGILRIVMPALSMGLAGYFLLTGRRAALLELCLWLFMATPGIRRVVDNTAGWDAVNYLMLSPYTASIVCVLPAIKGLVERRFAYSFPFVLLLGCVLYAALLAMIDGRLVAALFDALRWGVPPCVGLMIALEPENRIAFREVATRALTVGVSAMGAYAIYQYLFVPPWDAFWMNNVEMDSIGFPVPYLIRVFSTMNSPGSFAAAAMAGLLMVLPSRRWLRWPALGFGAAGVLLSIVRASWIGTALGLLYLLVAGRGWRVRGSILGAFLFVGLALSAVSTIPEAAQMIGDRIDSLTSLSGDTSATDRSNGYINFFNRTMAQYPFGRGLAINGVFVSSAGEGDTTVIDGAVIEIGTAMGVIGGVLYLGAVGIVVLVCMRAGMGAKDGFTSGCAAAVFALTMMLTSGTVTVGEDGFFYWVAAGFCMSAIQETSIARARSRMRVAELSA